MSTAWFRHNGYRIVVGALMAAGVAVRVVAEYPVHRTLGDADSLLTGMCALHVLRGHFPAFLAAGRQGAAECYVAAGAFSVFGASRASLFAEVLLIGVLGMIAAYLFCREILDRRAALIALVFIALPSPAVMLITTMPVGHATTFLLMSLVFFLSARVVRVGPKPWLLFAFGVAAGLGVWHTLLTIGATLPAAIWMLANDRRVARLAPAAAVGAVLGAAPWIGYNVIHPLRYFTESVAFGSSPKGVHILDNANYALTRDVVGLLFPRAGSAPEIVAIVRYGVSALFAGAAVYVYVRYVRSRRHDRSARALAVLAPLAIATAVVILVPTSLGSQRGWTVRYMLPVWFMAIPALAMFVAAVGRRSRIVATVLVIAVLVVAAAAYEWPGTAFRRFRTEGVEVDARLVRQLERNGVNAAVGPYWSTYPLNFLSKERIRAVPCDPAADYLHYEDELPDTARWALVYGKSGASDWVTPFVDRVKLEGFFEDVSPTYSVFVTTLDMSLPAARHFMHEAQANC